MDSQFPQVVIHHNIGNTIEIPNQLDVKVFTYLNTNIIAGTPSLPVDNATDFTDTSTPILVSQMGAEDCEVVVQSSNTTNTIACSSTLFPHNRGDIVQELNYDQIVVSWCATIDGTYAVLTTSTFQVTQQNTVIFHPAGLLTTFYQLQWKNSITGALSDFSAPISVSTYLPTSVAQIIYPVLKAMGVSENDSKINTDFCLSAVNDARKYAASKLYGIRQAWQQNFEFPIQILAGTNYVDLPDDIEFSETDRSVLAARFLIGNVLTPYNLRYIDKRSYNQIAFSVMGGYTTVLANIGDTTVSLDSAGDFPNTAGGVAYVATTDFTQTIMQIAYTAVDLTNNQLTGVTGITRSIPVGTRVWSRPTISQPIYYTVFENRMFFDRIIPDSMQGENVYIDYYTKLAEVTDLTQILPENYREMYKFYLRYAIKYRKDISLSSGDPDLAKFEELVQALFNNLYTGQDTTVITN